MPHYQLTDLNGETWLQQGSPVTPQYVRGIDGAPFEHDTIHGVGQRGITVTGTDLQAGQVAIGAIVHPVRHGLADAAAVNVLSKWRDGLGEGETQRGDNQMRLRLVESDRWQVMRLAQRPGPANWDRVRYTFILDEIVLQSDESDWRTYPLEYSFTAAQFATATVENHGTVPSWVRMRLTGPITNPRLGLLDEQVKLPNLAGGQYLEIDTDPNWYGVTDQAGVDRTMSLYTLAAVGGDDDRWRSQAPARTTGIPVNITGTSTTGATKLDVTVPQIYRSAL
ncbi:hypothetical protein [Gordonia insulae]|uniref:Minor tail protein n=1 Tax=Gordonia insulae TaxID=2420509 RepID=A0A3G8JE08_9ACTN|nr:hypothetical protein [Gordonia insulae]AZG43441.1 hypothetical protein D7316_00005 [Gordonia insulae]